LTARTIAVALVVAAAAAVPACRSGRTNAARCEGIEALVEPTEGHVLPPATVQYQHHPPTSGRHWHTPPTPGVHHDPIPEESQIAALERGIVLLQYGPAASAADRSTLERLAGAEVIVAPAVKIDGGRAIAFTAWQHRQRCDHADAGVARRFLVRFRGKPVI
jgi:hypothetical protein